MTKEREKAYAKSCTEIYEILKNLDKTELSKIPQEFINNIELNMDKNYRCELDYTKPLSELELLPETKALIIQIFERYLCSENQKEKWKKYDAICNHMIEEEKRKRYNPDDLFKNNIIQEETSEVQYTEEIQLIEYKQYNFINRMMYKLKLFFEKIKKKF